MVKHLIKTIKFYYIHYLILLALAMLFARPYLLYLLIIDTNIKVNSGLHQMISFMLDIGLCFIWTCIAFQVLQQQRYFSLTGRNYSKDKSKYKRTYHELVEYFHDADLFQMNTDDLKKSSWKDAEGIILGKTKDGKLFNIETGKDGKNYFIFGLPSSGKTAGPIICSCLRWGMHHPLKKDDKTTDGSTFVIDLKGDILKATQKYRNAKCFNLMDAKKSCHFNPLAGIEKLSVDDRVTFIENLSLNIVPIATGENRYFSETANAFFNGIALYLLDEDINTSFPDIIKHILVGNPVDWIKLICGSNCREAKNYLANKWGENEKNLSGAYANLAASARKFASSKLFYLLGNDPKYEYISPQTLEDGFDVYIKVDQAELKLYSNLLSMITQIFLNGFLTRDHNPKAGRLEDGTLRPIAFVLDEFAQLSTLSYDTIATAMMTLRSRNISIICALQSRSSIAEMFHSENACQSLIDCVTTFCFLSIQEVQTRKWASDLIGTKKVLKISNSLSDNTHGNKNTGRSVQEAIEPIFQPAEFGNLIDREKGRDEIIIYSQGKYIKLDKIYYYK